MGGEIRFSQKRRIGNRIDGFAPFDIHVHKGVPCPYIKTLPAFFFYCDYRLYGRLYIEDAAACYSRTAHSHD